MVVSLQYHFECFCHAPHNKTLPLNIVKPHLHFLNVLFTIHCQCALMHLMPPVPTPLPHLLLIISCNCQICCLVLVELSGAQWCQLPWMSIFLSPLLDIALEFMSPSKFFFPAHCNHGLISSSTLAEHAAGPSSRDPILEAETRAQANQIFVDAFMTGRVHDQS